MVNPLFKRLSSSLSRNSTPTASVQSLSKWAVLQYSYLAAVNGLLIFASLSAVGELIDCNELVDSGPEIVEPSRFTVNVENTIELGAEAFSFRVHQLDGYYCSCNATDGLDDVRFYNTTGGLSKYLGQPELVVNENLVEYCGPEPNCFETTSIIRFPLTVIKDHKEKTIGFNEYRNTFLKYPFGTTILGYEKRIEDSLRSKNLNSSSRLPIITQGDQYDDISSKWTFVPFNVAIRELKTFQANKLSEYEEAVKEAQEAYDNASKICAWNNGWVYIAFVMMLLTVVQIVWSIVLFYRFFKSKRILIIPQTRYRGMFFLITLTNILGIAFFSGLLTNVESVTGVVTISILVLNMLLHLLISKFEPMVVDPNLDKNMKESIKRDIRISVKRFSSTGFVLWTTILSVFVSIGLMTECMERKELGPKLENIKDYDSDLEAWVFDPARGNYATQHDVTGCSCTSEYNTTLERGENGSQWYLYDPELEVDTSDPNLFCGEPDSGCFVVSSLTMDKPPNVLHWVKNGTELLEPFYIFRLAVIERLREVGMLGSLELLDEWRKTPNGKPWIIRRHPMNGIFEYLILHRETIMNGLYKQQLSLRLLYESRNQAHLDKFLEEIETCDPERSMRALALAIVILSGFQILWLAALFGSVLVFNTSKSAMSFIGDKHYLVIIVYDSIIDIIYIAFFVSSLTSEVRIEIVLNLVILIGNIFLDAFTLNSLLFGSACTYFCPHQVKKITSNKYQETSRIRTQEAHSDDGENEKPKKIQESFHMIME